MAFNSLAAGWLTLATCAAEVLVIVPFLDPFNSYNMFS